MKKYLISIISVILINIILPCSAVAGSLDEVIPINTLGETQLLINLYLDIDTCTDVDGNKFNVANESIRGIISELEDGQRKVFEYANVDDYIVILNLCSPDRGNPYPEIEPLNVRIGVEEKIGGSRTYLMGTDFRLYRFDGDELYQIEITEADIKEVNFMVENLGYYVLYYNPHVYSVDFFEDKIEYDDNRNVINEVYFTATDLAQFDDLYFPEIPEKEGYIFAGWKHNKQKGAYYTCNYVEPQKDFLSGEWRIYPCDVRNVYASWCPEDEYTPLEVAIESKEKIKKGKEDGAEIVLTLSEGRFDDVIDADIENYWRIVGNDELSISNVERIDDTTVKLTLSGNSNDKYTSSEIQIEFNSELYISHEGFGDNYEVHEIADIQLDENGIKKAMFISDNSITLEKQKKSGSGGGVVKHTITFETNGGEEVQSVRVANGHCLAEPETPLYEGYVFKGWYTNEELTDRYDFEASVKEGFTLYAAWEKETIKDVNDETVVLPIEIIEKIIEEVIEFVKSIIK